MFTAIYGFPRIYNKQPLHSVGLKGSMSIQAGESKGQYDELGQTVMDREVRVQLENQNYSKI